MSLETDILDTFEAQVDDIEGVLAAWGASAMTADQEHDFLNKIADVCDRWSLTRQHIMNGGDVQ